MADAFFEQLDDGRFAATRHTAGPWSPDSQHLGPPSALLVKALEECPADRDMLLSRITIEILGPVPLTELTVSARVERPGKSVELLAASLDTQQRTVARASAWRIARTDSTSQVAGGAALLDPPSAGITMQRPDGWLGGYLDAMEWRSLHGSLADPGPACVWMRQLVPLVAGEQPTPLQRLLTVADSGNGVSGRLRPDKWWFINTELTVHVQREPVGEWIGLDANTVVGPDGVATALSVLHDEQGQVANGAQSLMVRPR